MTASIPDDPEAGRPRTAELPTRPFDAVPPEHKQLLGKYRLERVLGRGGMGVVVAARHLELGELFAIKLLDTVGISNAQSRFLREAQIAARMRSEHAVRVFDIGRLDDGTPYLIMEYLDGENLGEVLARRGRLPLAEAAALVLDACDALDEAHGLGIVHRDLKLSNIFLTTRRDGRPHLKVIDFGISKLLDAPDQLTRQGEVIGSPTWMSPEQYTDASTVDGRSDIWSLGVVLYQLITGEAPFCGTSFVDLYHRVLFDEPVPPSRTCPELPPAVDEVVARCLRKAPDERYANIAGLAAAVRTLLSTSHEPSASRVPPRVFLSCRRDDAEGRAVASALFDALAARGAHPVLPVHGVADPQRWRHCVAGALRDCEAFVVLLSPQGAVSEVVAAELDLALEIAARANGRPYILPLRIRLPDSAATNHLLQERLRDLKHATWASARDTELIAHSLIARLRPDSAQLARVGMASMRDAGTPIALPTAPDSPTPLERPGGLVARCSPFYVIRPHIDEECLHEILRTGALIRIKGPRQTGKSSLTAGIAEHAARSGARTVIVNLQMADAAVLADHDRFLRWLCAVTTKRLKLPIARIDDSWDDIFGAKDNCTAYFEEHLLPGGSLVIVLDQLDRLFETPTTAEETLTLIRAWHEMSKTAAPWDSLRLVLSYSTEMYLPLQTNHSPFNVGLPVVLEEWDSATVHDLARRHGLAWGPSEVERLMALIGGHPHLVRMALYHVACGMRLDTVLATAATDEGLFADHLRHLLWVVQGRPDLREATARMLRSSEPIRLSTELAFKLVSLGLASLNGNEVQPARALYRTYFQACLELV